jgi:hypothetical protein
MCHKVYRTLARSFRGMYPQSLSVYFSKPLSNKLSLFLLYVIASARGRANIHGVPRRRPSRDSLTLLPERAAACPLTVRRVWRSVVEGWAEDFSRHGAVDHGRCPMNAHGQARRWRLLPRAHSGLAHEFARRARASCLRTRASG